MKRAIIRHLMKFWEIFPAPDFCHPSFTMASEEEQRVIMLASAQSNYDEELKYPWARYFGFDLTSLLENKVVLDLGCYTGGKTIAWAQRYQIKEMHGIDIGDIFIKAARMFAETKGIEAHFTVSTAEELPFPDEKFDAILSYNTFEHVRDLKGVLLECKRVLKRQGKLLVVFPGYFHPFEHHLSSVTFTPFLHYFFSGKELIDVYNQIIDERGQEANWYRRNPQDLEPWERCNTINGTTRRSFKHLIKESDWSVHYRGKIALGRAGGALASRMPFAKPLSYLIQPFALLPIIEEAICQPIVYILEKP